MLETIFEVAIIIGIGAGLVQLSILLWELTIKRSTPHFPSSYVGISILKPLKGLDDQLENNLLTFFSQIYPKYEIILGVSDRQDPAYVIADRVRRQFPSISSKLIICDKHIGLNPKVNSLSCMYDLTTFDHILISDSNIAVQPDYLQSMVGYFQFHKLNLLTATVRGMAGKRLGSIMENLHLNTTVAASVLAARILCNRPLSLGKSFLITKQALERVGGFPAFRNVLGEDFLMGDAVRNMGMRVRTAPLPVNNINENWSLKQFSNRHSRWAKMRKHACIEFYLLEHLINPVFLAFIYLLLSPGWLSSQQFFMIALLITFIDTLMLRTMKSDLRSYQHFLIPVKDIIIGIIWFLPFFSSKIVWRGNYYRITKNTVLVPFMRGGQNAS